MAKKKKSFLPKKIAGVKVPKSVRKGRFGELLASQRGRAILAEAMLAAGAVVGAKKAADSPKAKSFVGAAAERVQDAGHEVTDKTSAATGVLAYALGEAARSFAQALNRPDGANAAPPEAAWTTDPLIEPESKKKPGPSPEAAAI
jgi:hypothetical protein